MPAGIHLENFTNTYNTIPTQIISNLSRIIVRKADRHQKMTGRLTL